MASIRNRKGKLYIDYYDAGGKRQRESLNLKNTRENMKKAEIIKKQIEYEISAGIMPDNLRRPIRKGMVLSEGLKQYESSKEETKTSTEKTYRNAIDKFIQLASDLRITEVTPKLVKEIEKKMKLEKVHNRLISGNTVISYMNRLHIVFNFFVKEKYVKKNPFPLREVDINDIVIIPDDHLEDILEKLKKKNRKHYKVITFLLLTGLRRGEIIGLTFEENVNFGRKILKVNNHKANRIDRLPIYDELKDFMITEWEKLEGPLFDYKSSQSLKFFEKFLKKEGYKNYSMHTLRKTFITKLINSGMSMFDVMKISRHKNMKTLLKYYAAAELNRMGNEISTKTNLKILVDSQKRSKLKLIKSA